LAAQLDGVPMTMLAADKKVSGPTILGDGAYTYEPVENWAKLPPG